MILKALIAATPLMALAAPAFAGPALDALKAEDCGTVAGGVSNDRVIDRLTQAAGTPVSQDVARARLQHRLGAMAHGDPDLFALLSLARDMVADPPGSSADFAVTVDAQRPADQNRRAIDLLNDDAPWLHVACRAQPSSGGSAAAAEEPAPLIVRASVEDAAKDLDSADPASFSWKRDRAAGATEAEVDLFIGFPDFSTGALALHLRPYLAYQRKTGDEPVNDLTLGAFYQRRFMLGSSEPVKFTAQAGWETDDKLKSSAFRADANFAPALGVCGRRNNLRWGAMCTPVLTMDLTHVGDPGDKTALVGQKDFTRLGASLDAALWVYPTPDYRITFKGGYVFRRSLGDRDADAHLATASVMVSPTANENFGFGVEWKQGRDLSSLEPIDEVAIKITYKR